MKEIIQNLWIGSYEDVQNVVLLKSFNIKFILTVMNVPVENMNSNFRYKFIKAYDIDSEDLLSHFDDAYGFISEGIKTHGVIVHCLAGISRSGTIITAYIMKCLKLDPNEAIEKVRQKSFVSPNTGFMRQLKLYYKYNWNSVKNTSNSTENVINTEFDQMKQSKKEITTDIKCKKCRYLLFNNHDFVSHIRASGKNISEEVQCTDEIFIEPVDWVDTTNPTGKINCPKCACKLGSYTWVGEKCVCKAWVVPAFHISKQKVDVFKNNIFNQ